MIFHETPAPAEYADLEPRGGKCACEIDSFGDVDACEGCLAIAYADDAFACEPVDLYGGDFMGQEYGDGW
jgi:hypothetical protein